MSSITPITLGADLVTYGRGVESAYRATRPPEQPAIDPPAVILPRTAAWLNVPVAADLTGNLGQNDASGFDQPGSPAPAPEATAQPSLVASLNAQTAAANAASATATTPQGAESPSAGIGSVVQLV